MPSRLAGTAEQATQAGILKQNKIDPNRTTMKAEFRPPGLPVKSELCHEYAERILSHQK